ncbi:hypothetical protein K402DRAFT_295268, partial [Aulographum hederae CBS 113979]
RTSSAAGPGHDIFSTPANSQFHSHARYESLDSHLHEIRLIKLSFRNQDDLIHCELLQRLSVDSLHSQFTAISYCAGNSQDTKAIIVDGIQFNVFANLEHALRKTKNFWAKTHPDKDCFLWVDQICINQADLAERSHQVSLMRDVYQSAEHVLVCLSNHDESGVGLDWLNQLLIDVPPLEPPDFTLRRTPSRVASIESLYSQQLTCHIWENTTRDDFVHGWLALYDVLECEWWSQAWVFQEFIVSRNCHFMCGSQSSSWSVFCQVLPSLLSIHKHILTSRDLFLSKTGFSPDGPEDQRFCKVTARARRAETTVRAVNFVINSKRTWSGTKSLKKLLLHSRNCRTSDDRDRVYAFLGLAEAGYRIMPDYSSANSIIATLVETAKCVIRFDQNLQLLHHATAARGFYSKQLPSWVPDWT